MTPHAQPFDGLLIGSVTMLAVRDLSVAIDFYQHRLGFELVSHDQHIAGLRLGDLQLYLFTESPPTPDKPSLTLVNLNTADRTAIILDFLVADCHAAYERLQANGVEFLTPPHTPPWGGLRCFARDPDGYLIELEQNANSPFLPQPAGEAT